MAEESTSWPQVTAHLDGWAGFSMKWNMGWMHDILCYMKEQPYIVPIIMTSLPSVCSTPFREFVLPFSHDEVVHGKGSLLNKIPETNGSVLQIYACFIR